MRIVVPSVAPEPDTVNVAQRIEPGQRPAGYVHSLDRGLAVIRCFSAERPRLTLSEVAGLTGLSRAAARRSLLTLQP